VVEEAGGRPSSISRPSYGGRPRKTPEGRADVEGGQKRADGTPTGRPWTAFVPSQLRPLRTDDRISTAPSAVLHEDVSTSRHTTRRATTSQTHARGKRGGAARCYKKDGETVQYCACETGAPGATTADGWAAAVVDDGTPADRTFALVCCASRSSTESVWGAWAVVVVVGGGTALAV